MKIYLAGKITKNGWRDQLVGYRCGGGYYGLPGEEPEFSEDGPPFFLTGNPNESWPILKGVLKGHDYVGPFMVACDHGCYHDGASHGASTGGEGCGDGGGWSRGKIVKMCLEAIDRADLVFAWMVDAPSAYGSLIEIGYARGRGKRVVVASPEEMFDDLWFVGKASSQPIVGTLQECFDKAIAW